MYRSTTNSTASASNRGRTGRRTHQLRRDNNSGNENNNNSRSRPPSLSLMKNNTNNNNSGSPPTSPLETDTQHGASYSNRRPRTPITRPPLMQQQQGWEEAPESSLWNNHHKQMNYYPSDARSVASERKGRSSYSASQPPEMSSSRSVVSDTFLIHGVESGDADSFGDEDIPMDERSADIRSVHNGRPSSANSRPISSVDVLRMTHTYSPPANNTGQRFHSSSPPAHDDEISSLGGVEETNSNLNAMTAALRSKTTTLHGLSPEERLLWDAVQTLLKQTMADASKADSNNDSEELLQLREKIAQQEREQANALRAMQRVLADVTQQRDHALAELAQRQEDHEEKKDDQIDATNASNVEESPGIDHSQLQNLQAELETKRKEITDLNETILQLKAAKEASDGEVNVQKKNLAKLKRHLQYQRYFDDGNKSPVPNESDVTNDLKKQLEDKSDALENAKMIIASLENASGSLASDTRAKLKAKDAEIAALNLDLQECKKKLDTLATELRDAQTSAAAMDEYRTHLHRQSTQLPSALKATLSDLRSASVILETTHDASSIQNLPELIEDCIEALKRSLDAFDESGEICDDSDGDGGESSCENQLQAEKRALQEEVLTMKETALHYRIEAERIEKKRDHDVRTLYAELQMLRLECTANKEALAKKERELAVLRDSLKVEDQAVGYISDDGTEADEDNDGTAKEVSPPPPNPAILGKLQRPITNTVTGGIEELKVELAQACMEKERVMKELKTEKESLANAKMIISSLERANKSMMEDLRSRLHESNTAIASLLEKSVESEKKTAQLQAELDLLRKAKKDAGVVAVET